MKLQFTPPTESEIAGFLQQSRPDIFTYDAVGATHNAQSVSGFDNDHNRVCLGSGEACFRAASARLFAWEMFPTSWVRILPERVPIRTGQSVAMVARAFGIYWINAAQIVYTIDEPRRCGFAYGTLETHIECGEERFLVEWLPDDSVWYDLYAFSRPRHWLIRLGYPLARRLQRRFVRDSQATFHRIDAKEETHLSMSNGGYHETQR